MTASLILNSNSAANGGLTVDVSNYLDLTDGSDIDPQNPSFSNKVISHSLLKEGGVLALEDFQNKELLFPVRLNAPQTGPFTNLVPNPSLQYDTVGQAPAAWSTGAFSLNGGATISVQSTPAGVVGSHQLEVQTTAALAFEGACCACPGITNFLSGQLYTAAIWVQGAAGGEVIEVVVGSTADDAADATFTLTTGWQRLIVPWTPSANRAGATHGIAVRSHTAAAITFFVDGAMIVPGAVPPVYVDGDQFGCQWNGPPGNSTSTGPTTSRMAQQINQVVTSPGATFSWQPPNASQPTIFDGISGEFDVKYRYREDEKHWATGDLKLFTQPFGRTSGPRPYAAASGVGPLLIISPYASGTGQTVVGASTQAGAAGYGGIGQGGIPSSGIFYPGSPQLAGDAPALLQISYLGPLAPGTPIRACIPYVAVSVLPDALYRPLITSQEISSGTAGVRVSCGSAIAGQYLSLISGQSTTAQAAQLNFLPLAQRSYSSSDPTTQWAGQHRLMAIARASGAGTAHLYMQGGPLNGFGATVTLQPQLDWGLYDLGVFALRASEYPLSAVPIGAIPTGQASGLTLDIAGLVMLPDNKTWFLRPTAVIGSVYGWDQFINAGVGATAPYTNTLLFDDVLGDQFVFAGMSQTSAPSPIGSVPSAAPITQYSRGLIPRPDPKNGSPIIAILGMPQNVTQPFNLQNLTGGFNQIVGGSWPVPLNLRTMAQVNVLERARYVMP